MGDGGEGIYLPIGGLAFPNCGLVSPTTCSATFFWSLLLDLHSGFQTGKAPNEATLWHPGRGKVDYRLFTLMFLCLCLTIMTISFSISLLYLSILIWNAEVEVDNRRQTRTALSGTSLRREQVNTTKWVCGWRIRLIVCKYTKQIDTKRRDG